MQKMPCFLGDQIKKLIKLGLNLGFYFIHILDTKMVQRCWISCLGFYNIVISEKICKN